MGEGDRLEGLQKKDTAPAFVETPFPLLSQASSKLSMSSTIPAVDTLGLQMETRTLTRVWAAKGHGPFVYQMDIQIQKENILHLLCVPPSPQAQQ